MIVSLLCSVSVRVFPLSLLLSFLLLVPWSMLSELWTVWRHCRLWQRIWWSLLLWVEILMIRYVTAWYHDEIFNCYDARTVKNEINKGRLWYHLHSIYVYIVPLPLSSSHTFKICHVIAKIYCNTESTIIVFYTHRSPRTVNIKI